MDTHSLHQVSDLVIEDQADENAALRELIEDLAVDLTVRDQMIGILLSQVHRLTGIVKRQSETIVRLHEVLRDQAAAERGRAA